MKDSAIGQTTGVSRVDNRLYVKSSGLGLLLRCIF